jgi:hypothetical protein
MAIILDGNIGLTYPDVTTQNTSAIISGKLPTAKLPAGSVIQVVNFTLSTQQSTTNSTATATALTASITPSSASSRIYVSISSDVGQSTSGRSAFYYVYRNSTSLLQYEQFFNTVAYYPMTLTYLDSPSTTSSTAYTLYFRTDGVGTVYASNGNTLSSITLMEIQG